LFDQTSLLGERESSGRPNPVVKWVRKGVKVRLRKPSQEGEEKRKEK